MNKEDSTGLPGGEDPLDIVEGSPEVFDGLALARELGVENPRFPEEQYRAGEDFIRGLLGEIIPQLGGMNEEQILEYCVEHTQQLFDIFDRYPIAHRLPLLLKDNFLKYIYSAHESQNYARPLAICIKFMLYASGARSLFRLGASHAEMSVVDRARAKVDVEIRSAWGIKHHAIFSGEQRSRLFSRIIAGDPKCSTVIDQVIYEALSTSQPYVTHSQVSQITHIVLIRVLKAKMEGTMEGTTEQAIQTTLKEVIREEIPEDKEGKREIYESGASGFVTTGIAGAVDSLERTIIERLAMTQLASTSQGFEYAQAVLQYLQSDELPCERFFLSYEGGDLLKIVIGGRVYLYEKLLTPEVLKELHNHDADALSFLLCQTQLNSYDDFLSTLTSSPDFFPAWCRWIERFYDQIIDRNSQVHKVFCHAFHIKGPIFVDGKIPKKLQRKGISKKRLPDCVCTTLEACRKGKREFQRLVRESAAQDSVARISVSPGITAVERLARVQAPAAQLIVAPTRSIFRFGGDRNNLDLSGFPLGTSIALQRKLNTEKIFEDTIYSGTITDSSEMVTIPAPEPSPTDRKFVYGLQIELPEGYSFGSKGRMFTVVSDPIFVKKDESLVTKATTLETPPIKTSPSKTPLHFVAVVKETTERVLDTVGISLTAVSLILEEVKTELIESSVYRDGAITFVLTPEILARFPDEACAILPEHNCWIVTSDGAVILAEDAGTKIAVQSAGFYDVRDICLVLAENVRERELIRQEEQAELLQQASVDVIDSEFHTLGFASSPALDNTHLRSELSARIGYISKEEKNMMPQFDVEIQRLLAGNESTYRFYRGTAIEGLPKSITFGKKGQDGWMATLTLHPGISFDLSNGPSENSQLFSQRLENILLTFVYDILKNGSNTVQGLVRETRAKEDIARLKKRYRGELSQKRARILVQNGGGKFHIIGGIHRDNLQQKMAEAQQQYGEDNVALLLRSDTLHFYGENSVVTPNASRVSKTYEDFYEEDVGEERRAILQARIISTLFGSSHRDEREGFIIGSGADITLTELKKTVERELGRDLTPSDITNSYIPLKRATADAGEDIPQSDISRDFVERFIIMLRGEKDKPVPVSYINYRVSYCDDGSVAELIAD